MTRDAHGAERMPRQRAEMQAVLASGIDNHGPLLRRCEAYGRLKCVRMLDTRHVVHEDETSHSKSYRTARNCCSHRRALESVEKEPGLCGRRMASDTEVALL
jgi:hypothetical protein